MELGGRVSWARTHAAILKTERTEDSRDLRNFNSLDSRGAGLAVGARSASGSRLSVLSRRRLNTDAMIGSCSEDSHMLIITESGCGSGWWGVQLTQVWEPSSQPLPHPYCALSA